jgi:TonB family protein
MLRMRCFLVLLLFSFCLRPAIQGQAPDAGHESDRKIVKKIMPRYPEVARRMNLSGTVKVVAIVAPDGKVRSVEPVGGSPVLIQAAKDAITGWKFAPASAESKESIELHFNPD